MRVLVLTNHFADFAGSEIVALEIVEWFLAAGDDVTLGANHVRDPIARCAPPGIKLTDAPEAMALEGFDLVWCQHNLLAQWPLAAFIRLVVAKRVPHVAFVSLSPYEPYEDVDFPVAAALSGEIFVNSPETRRKVLDRASHPIGVRDIHVFHNAAPGPFWDQGARAGRAAGALPRSVALISNHPPPEALRALRKIANAGVDTRVIGKLHDYRRVQPADFHAVDAVITIGKSVPYAVATGTPVYMYDRFGGDGWLGRHDFGTGLEHNFSGRPGRRKLSAEAIAQEVLGGFAAAVEEARRFGGTRDFELLSLDRHLSALRKRAALGAGEANRVARLRRYLDQPDLRAAFDGSLARRHAMKRSYMAPWWRRVWSPAKDADTVGA